MTLPETEELELLLENGVLSVLLNRPHKRNAMNSKMVDELMQVFDAIADSSEVRAVVLRGCEGNFCAGGDISGMDQDSRKGEQDDGKSAGWRFNRSFGYLITKVNQAPQLVVTVLEGAVLGGGFGLACISDVAIADENAQFAMPETGLGIIPAQIAPFVVMRVGLTQARRLALLGERINGLQAAELGIVHHVESGPEQLDQRLEKVLKLLKNCAPQANAVTKKLLLDVAEVNQLESLLDRASDDFDSAISGPEGQEGMQAFLQKRKPDWAQ